MFKTLIPAALIAVATVSGAQAMSLPTFADIVPTIAFPSDDVTLSTKGDPAAR